MPVSLGVVELADGDGIFLLTHGEGIAAAATTTVELALALHGD